MTDLPIAPPIVPSIVPLQQSSTEDLLTLKDLAERLGVTYGRLRGFAEVPGVAPYVGAVAVPGVKGVRYSPGAEGQFRRLITAQDAGEVTPRTAKAHLQNLLVAPLSAIAERQQSDNPSGEAGIARLQQPSTQAMSTQPSGQFGTQIAGQIAGQSVTQSVTQSGARDLADILGRLVTLQEHAAPAPDDRLVGRDEAAGMLACRPRSVGRYVRPVRADAWRLSDLRRYIAALVQR